MGTKKKKKKNLDTLCRCDSCGHEDDAGDHDPAEIDDLLARVEPGGTMPAGQCVKCKALTYLVRNPVHQDLARMLREAAEELDTFINEDLIEELKEEANKHWEI